MKFDTRLFVLVLALGLVSLVLTGCSEDEPDSGRMIHIPEEVVVLASQDEAMTHFKEVMEERDIDLYRELVSPEFIFDGKDDVVYGYDGELSIMTKIFNELEGESGIVISNLVVNMLNPNGVWTETPEENEVFGQFAGSWCRQYDVGFSFYLQGQNLIFRSIGFAVFYMINSGTAEEPDFKLLGITDQTYGHKGVEGHTLTSIKELFN